MPFCIFVSANRLKIDAEGRYSTGNRHSVQLRYAIRPAWKLAEIGRGPPGRQRHPELQALSNSLQLASF